MDLLQGRRKGWCLDVSDRCLKVGWKESDRCLKGVWKVSSLCPTNSPTQLGTNFYLELEFDSGVNLTCLCFIPDNQSVLVFKQFQVFFMSNPTMLRLG